MTTRSTRECDGAACFDILGFRDDLDKFLEHQGMSKREFAKRTGAAQGTVYGMFEARARVPTLHMVAAFAYIADLDLNKYVIGAW